MAEAAAGATTGRRGSPACAPAGTCAQRRATSSPTREVAAAAGEAAELGWPMTVDGSRLGDVLDFGDAVAAALPALPAGAGQDEEPLRGVRVNDARDGVAALPASDVAFSACGDVPLAAACRPTGVAIVVGITRSAATAADGEGAAAGPPPADASAVASVGL
eukprot:TRINITY_DN3176_c0_g1_i1.p3 TRINITY_DN3176_c0_g1~~TRINITY_DN3176_c0_g1_i1.p3  ORF type:complete len:162 (+),score=42.67 TRINITY_DN3176_c0_g1_i1:1156-1641(+)